MAYPQRLHPERTSEDTDRLMESLIHEVRDSERELRRHLERGKQEIERAMTDLDEGMMLNSCGVLQSTGTEIDKLVAQRHDRITALIKTAFHLGYDRPTTDLWK